jgi:hypothetical protein
MPQRALEVAAGVAVAVFGGAGVAASRDPPLLGRLPPHALKDTRAAAVRTLAGSHRHMPSSGAHHRSHLPTANPSSMREEQTRTDTDKVGSTGSKASKVQVRSAGSADCEVSSRVGQNRLRC